MPLSISVEAAKAIADQYQLRQVILVASDGERSHVLTYGGSVHDSDLAAEGGNFVKRALGWPETLRAESPKVTALMDRIKALEARVAGLGTADHPGLRLMRRAFEADPAAIERLLSRRVPCNQDLADDPAVIVGDDGPNGGYTLGVLGLVNGLMDEMGMPRVAAVYDDEKELVGFTLYRPPLPVPDRDK